MKVYETVNPWERNCRRCASEHKNHQVESLSLFKSFIQTALSVCVFMFKAEGSSCVGQFLAGVPQGRWGVGVTAGVEGCPGRLWPDHPAGSSPVGPANVWWWCRLSGPGRRWCLWAGQGGTAAELLWLCRGTNTGHMYMYAVTTYCSRGPSLTIEFRAKFVSIYCDKPTNCYTAPKGSHKHSVCWWSVVRLIRSLIRRLARSISWCDES